MYCRRKLGLRNCGVQILSGNGGVVRWPKQRGGGDDCISYTFLFDYEAYLMYVQYVYTICVILPRIYFVVCIHRIVFSMHVCMHL